MKKILIIAALFCFGAFITANAQTTQTTPAPASEEVKKDAGTNNEEAKSAEKSSCSKKEAKACAKSGKGCCKDKSACSKGKAEAKACGHEKGKSEAKGKDEKASGGGTGQ
jgi:hypothetical protein